MGQLKAPEIAYGGEQLALKISNISIRSPHSINRQTIKMYILCLINDLLEEVSSWKSFSKIDLSAAYHQIPLNPSEQPLTVFEANWSH